MPGADATVLRSVAKAHRELWPGLSGVEAGGPARDCSSARLAKANLTCNIQEVYPLGCEESKGNVEAHNFARARTSLQ